MPTFNEVRFVSNSSGTNGRRPIQIDSDARMELIRDFLHANLDDKRGLYTWILTPPPSQVDCDPQSKLE